MANQAYLTGVPIPQTMNPDGQNVYGARKEPSCMSKCCFPPCAISGFEHGDPTEGSMTGNALIPFICSILCGCIAGLYVLVAWKPDPNNIAKTNTDGTQRTLKNRCMAVCCLGGPCAIAFWQSGDACEGCCDGDAGVSCMINCIGSIIGFPSIGSCWACCFWEPNLQFFRRDASMHGARPKQAGDQAMPMVGAPVAMAMAQTAPMPAAVAVAQPAPVPVATATVVGQPAPVATAVVVAPARES